MTLRIHQQNTCRAVEIVQIFRNPQLFQTANSPVGSFRAVVVIRPRLEPFDQLVERVMLRCARRVGMEEVSDNWRARPIRAPIS